MSGDILQKWTDIAIKNRNDFYKKKIQKPNCKIKNLITEYKYLNKENNILYKKDIALLKLKEWEQNQK